jgi:hypothetical protein
MRPALTIALTICLLGIIGCTTTEKATPPPPAKPRPNFVTPTAEEAYRLQDDCTRRGDKILRDNLIGSALTQEQVSRYNETTNRCYVRVEVHAKDLSELNKYDYSTYLEDGQTGQSLAYYRHKPDGNTAYIGFGCRDSACVEEKVAACMSGKECEPQQ